MGKLAEMQEKQRGLIHKCFCDEYLKLFHRMSFDSLVYEAPAAESWVVIIGQECWVAASDREEFVFWGPLGKKPVSFNIPDGWPI